jgi:DNA repair protein RadA/Sms
VRLRAERTGNLHAEMYLAAESELSALLGQVDQVKPSMLIVDSIQTMSTMSAQGGPGGVTQVRAVASGLIAMAKERGLPIVLVGHVTKDGSVAGPRVLEHLVDVVLQFEGDRHSSLRLLRGIKNRYGAADEVGCFELRDDGIACVPDPSGLFLTRREKAVEGTCVTVIVEGKRPMLGEVQALVAKTNLPAPRRAVSGLDSARVAMVLAVVEKRAGLKVGNKDVYVATVGGMKITEPGIDLAVVLALISSATDTPLSPKLVAMGEVGLSGEVRRVPSVGRRLAEAARLGFERAYVPAANARHAEVPKGLELVGVETVADALDKLE